MNMLIIMMITIDTLSYFTVVVVGQPIPYG